MCNNYIFSCAKTIDKNKHDPITVGPLFLGSSNTDHKLQTSAVCCGAP